ncbi:hypothetical protein ACFW1A_13250 [Kitasatospora sp. NPDC058965]|uniref:hypothetical protein n=1 Tax=Kitasatospora sp. NPDC058965 TaxID=3346682 RepID=UPI0036AAAD79
MTLRQFTKHYETPERAAAAVRHYTWLRTHVRPFALPDLLGVEPTRLHFQDISRF